jgi:hypothetical protein
VPPRSEDRRAHLPAVRMRNLKLDP